MADSDAKTNVKNTKRRFTKASGKPGKKRRGRPSHLPLIGLILIAALALTATLIAFDNTRISVVTRTVSIPGLPQQLEGYTIVQLSDLNGAQFGDKQSKLAETVNNVRYDVICMTGDMIGGSGDAQPLYDLIDALGTQKPILYIAGDSDPEPVLDAPNDGDTLYADYIEALRQRGVTYLDSPYMVESGSARIWFSSALQLNINTQDILNTAQADYNAAMQDAAPNRDAAIKAAYRLNCAQLLNDAAKNMKADDVHITLSHVPLSDDFVRSLQYTDSDQSRATDIELESTRYLRMIDVALCGHFVGGQWRVPLYGALYVPDERLERGGWLPNQDYVTGLRRINSVYVNTSSGLGVSDAYNLPSFRLFNTPQVVVIKLTGALS